MNLDKKGSVCYVVNRRLMLMKRYNLIDKCDVYQYLRVIDELSSQFFVR
ncbi:hypothetical protein THOB06_150059 [Vibrio rotiferianus]|nr:hypothetical protein THOG10_150059 [Vibrio rotiferianus]CAH1566401.1 hypothetical protein THOB06_150059 [Vibrio rotiferianus]